MPDGVTIGITSTYSGAGVSQAMNDLGGLEKFARNTSANMGRLDETVARARATLASSATPALTFGQRLAYMSDMANNFVTGAAKFGAVAAGIGLATKKVFEFGQSGAQIDYTTEKFDRLSRSAGSMGSLFISQLRTATRGTVSDFELMKQGSDLLQLGLAGSTKEAVRLSSVMTALGMDTGELTLALANQSKRRLDQLGLSLTKFNEIEARLKESGMSKQDAFKEAFLQTAEQTVMLTGNRADSALAPYLQLQASGANVWNNLKQMTGEAIAPDVQNFANLFRAMDAVQRGEMAWGGNLFEIMSGSAPALIPASQNIAQLAQEQWMQNNTQYMSTGRGAITIRPGTAPSAQDFLYEDAAVRRGNAYNAQQISAEQQEADYAALLSVGMDTSNMLGKFNARTLELNNSLREESEVLSELTKKYGVNSDKVQEQEEKIASLQSAIVANGNALVDSTEQIGLAMLKTAGASEEQQLTYARASGMITQDAYETSTALSKLSKAAADGTISTDQYASAVSQLNDWVSQMDGLQVDTYIDVWIREHGSSSSLPIVSSRPGVCFVAGTQITMADGSRKPIEQVQIGDAVLSYDTDERAYVDGKVTQLFRHDTDEYLDIDGLLVTPEHPFWVVGRGWVKAGDVRKGDLFLCDNTDFKEVEIIIRLHVNTVVYNLEVDDVHTYFAGGVLVHNKVASNAWSGGPVNNDGFTVVGDAPGGVWTPYTEVIYNGHVFNAHEARALKEAGLLEGATYAGAGTGGSTRTSGRYRPRSSGSARERSGRTGTQYRSRTSLTSVSSGDIAASVEDAAVTAADVAEQAAQVSQQATAQSQSVTSNIQQSTAQTVQAQEATQVAIVEKLDEVAGILKRQANKNELYALYKGAGQTSI